MQHRRFFTGLLLCSFCVWACGPEVQPEEEPPYQVPDRIEGCSTWCGAKFECGDGPGNGVSFHTEDECIEWCAKPDSDMVGFYYLGNGVDACVEEYNTMANCIDALSCEETRVAFDTTILISERPCYQQTIASLDCAYAAFAADHPD